MRDGLEIYHKMYYNIEFIFIHPNQSENANVILTFNNIIHGQKNTKPKNLTNPIPRILFLFLGIFSVLPKIVTYMKEVMHFS